MNTHQMETKMKDYRKNKQLRALLDKLSSLAEKNIKGKSYHLN